MGNDYILVAADLLENVCLELGKIGLSALRAGVSHDGSFEVSDALSNLVGGLIRLPYTYPILLCKEDMGYLISSK